jgi:endonuclease VIII
MPEGPEIARAAAEIAGAICQQRVLLIEFAFASLKPFCAQINDSTVRDVRFAGKAMLVEFSCALTMYSHNQLYGQWAILQPQEPANPRLQTRVAIHTAKAVAVLYSASDIEVWPSANIHQQPYIAKLGLELLATATTIADVRRAIAAPQFQNRRVTQLLLDQGFLAGLGNYLRSDIMFVARINPAAKLAELTAEQRDALAVAALTITQQSFTTGGVTNDLVIAETMRKRGATFGAYRHWVFDRAGEPCLVCASTIVREDISGRAVFYCPTCQR